jgi:hypothetical protein
MCSYGNIAIVTCGTLIRFSRDYSAERRVSNLGYPTPRINPTRRGSAKYLVVQRGRGEAPPSKSKKGGLTPRERDATLSTPSWVIGATIRRRSKTSVRFIGERRGGTSGDSSIPAAYQEFVISYGIAVAMPAVLTTAALTRCLLNLPRTSVPLRSPNAIGSGLSNGSLTGRTSQIAITRTVSRGEPIGTERRALGALTADLHGRKGRTSGSSNELKWRRHCRLLERPAEASGALSAYQYLWCVRWLTRYAGSTNRVRVVGSTAIVVGVGSGSESRKQDRSS